MKAAAWLLLASLLGGCALGAGDRTPHVYHTLQIADGQAAPAPASASPWASASNTRPVFVAPVLAAPFYASDRIVYSRTPATRGYYQLNSWTEPLTQSLRRALVGRLEASGAFAAVATSPAQSRNPLVLQIVLDEAYHDAKSPPGTVRVVITAELSDPTGRAALRRNNFQASAPAASFDAAGAASALGVACGAVLDRVSAWAASEPRSGP